MRRWLDPWPAIADLFAGLLIGTFGALMLVTGRPEFTGIPDPVDVEAAKIRQAVLDSLKPLGGETRKCGDDVCLDVTIEFDTSSDRVLPRFRKQLAKASQAVARSLSDDRRKDLEIFIEGHTDYRPPRSAATRRDRYLYNWRLSAARASSVLYEFKSRGVDPGKYRVVAIGYADTVPLCVEKTFRCLQQNRRTTFRLRPDRRRIEERLNASRAARLVPASPQSQ